MRANWKRQKQNWKRPNYYLLDIQRNSLIYIMICGKYCSTLNSKPICYGKKAEPSQIPAFSEQIRLTRNAIDENLLLIEDEHYKKLIKLIGQFEQFQFGKQKLIDIRAQRDENMASQITKKEARETINQNRKTKENYDNLIMDIGKSFRTQIKG